MAAAQVVLCGSDARQPFDLLGVDLQRPGDLAPERLRRPDGDDLGHAAAFAPKIWPTLRGDSFAPFWPGGSRAIQIEPPACPPLARMSFSVSCGVNSNVICKPAVVPWTPVPVDALPLSVCRTVSTRT